MQKLLPKTAKNPRGFTLIELLVVITIIAILAVIGFTVYSGLQMRARNAKAKLDIDSIAKALEVNYTALDAKYHSLNESDFSGGIPEGIKSSYCIKTGNTTPANPSGTWLSGCPGAEGYELVRDGNPAGTFGAWKVCASLESEGPTVPAEVFCKANAQ